MQHNHRPRDAGAIPGEYETQVLGISEACSTTPELESAAAVLSTVRLHAAHGTRTLALLAQVPGAQITFDAKFANNALAAAKVHLARERTGDWRAYAVNKHGVVHTVLERMLEPVAVVNQPLGTMEALVVLEPGAPALWRAHTSVVDTMGPPRLMVGVRATIKSGTARTPATVYALADDRVAVKRDLICAWDTFADNRFALPILMPHPFAATEWFSRTLDGAYVGDDGVSLLEVDR